jgi:uncharacterized membrane protein (GlpM family)
MKKGAGTTASPTFTRKSRRYCFTGALDAAGFFEALDELAVFAVVALLDFLAFLVVLVVEVCGVAGALEGGVLCANIAAAVNIVVRIMRFIFVSPLMGCFRSPLAYPSCSRMLFGTLAPAGD